MKFASALLALVVSSITLAATALDLSDSYWIWTNELPSLRANVPPGERAFRRLIPTPRGVTPVLANILITADDTYTLFVNGDEVGRGYNYHVAQSYCVPLSSPVCGTLVAVTGDNYGTAPNPAGVVASIELTFSDGSMLTVVTNGAWKAFNSSSFPSDYMDFSFDDSSWPNAVEEGLADGLSPWGNTELPANTSCS